MAILPQLETKRLILRVPEADDAKAMVAFVTENRDHFAPWEPMREDRYYTVDHWHTQLELGVERAIAGAGIQFVLVSRDGPHGRVLGQCTLSNIARGPFQAAFLGYGLDKSAVGKGLMEEALRATIAYCFGDMNLHRIMANYMPSNTRSAKLLNNLGFYPEGHARDYLYLAGEWQDHVLTALVNSEWRPA